MTIMELTETKKLSDEKVLVNKKLSGATIKSFDNKTGKWEEEEVELTLPITEEGVTMDEKWMKDELVALRSTVDVALQSANSVSGDIATINQETLHSMAGKRLWDDINDEKLTVQAQEAQDIYALNQKIEEQQKQIDTLMEIVQKLVTQKKENRPSDSEVLDNLLKRMISPTPTTPTNPITTQPPYRTRNGKSSFGGPYYQGPTLTCDLSDLADNKIEVKKGE